MDMEIKEINVRDLRTNSGQIAGLPRNPRKISKKQLEKLKKSVADAPEMLQLRELIVVENGNEFVVIAGNQRLEAAKSIGMKSVPCKVLPADTPAEKLREYAIKDNLPFGEDDWEVLNAEWDKQELEDWGMPIPREKKEIQISEEEKEKINQWLNEAMHLNVIEVVNQLDVAKENGFFITGLTEGFVKARFLRTKFFNDKFPQWISYYWNSERFNTPAGCHKIGMMDNLRKIAKEGKAGIKGLRTCTEDGDIVKFVAKGSYPISGAMVPMDFNSETTRDLILEFAGENAKFLDPCHGWGGRYVGALLADCEEYTSFDPSESAHKGLEKCDNMLRQYSSIKTVSFNMIPFENSELKANYYDIAITSPPYFDVEKYEGENQSHILYPNYELWKEKFYNVLIEKVFDALKRGGVFCLNVGSQRYPLKKDGINIAHQCGFEMIEERELSRETAGKLHNTNEDLSETIIILKKN